MYMVIAYIPVSFLYHISIHVIVGLRLARLVCIAGTICIRICMFPLVILAQRNAVELQNNMPTMQRLQDRMIVARRSGDHVGGKV